MKPLPVASLSSGSPPGAAISTYEPVLEYDARLPERLVAATAITPAIDDAYDAGNCAALPLSLALPAAMAMNTPLSSAYCIAACSVVEAPSPPRLMLMILAPLSAA